MIFKKYEQTKLYYGLVSLLFVLINYSYLSWNFFYKLGGLALAKAGPEVVGIVFFLILSKVYLSKFYPKHKLQINKKDLYAIFLFLVVGIIFHYKQFLTYFYKDDIYFWLNRNGIGYSVYTWEPWLSSHPGWVWELVRYVFGYSIFPYQLAAILSHVFLGLGVYLLSKYLSKNYYIGLVTTFLFLVTTISFEAFQWLSHPINFGWQGFFVCISLIALVWEIEINKNKSVPYLSAFLMMPAFGAGIARIGFVLPLISITLFLITAKYINFNKNPTWLKGFCKNQWIFYSMFIVFFCVRNLWAVETTRSEVITASLFKIYLYVVGIFSFPVELFVLLSKLTSLHISTGIITVFFGILFQIVFVVAVLITKRRNKKFPLIVSLGFFWVILSAVYFTMYGPHLPTTDIEIDISARTHHLAYLSSIGALMIWGYCTYKFIKLLKKFKRPYSFIVLVLLVGGLVIINYSWLSKQYDYFLELPKNVKVTRQEFFFETYKKYVPDDAKIINIFYDNGYLLRKDNYKPLDGYFWGFWDRTKVKIIIGDVELKEYLDSFSNNSLKDEEIKNLYYIYTDYDNGPIEDNLSQRLIDSVNNPVTKIIKNEEWKPLWGNQDVNIFFPNININNSLNLKYFKNPIITVNKLDFPAVLTPNLNIRLNVIKANGSNDYLDLRGAILSEILSNWQLPDKNKLLSYAEYSNLNKEKNTVRFLDIINTPNILSKMVCEEIPKEGGLTLFVSWVGEPDSYYSKLSPEEKNNIFSPKYNQRFYSLCYFSEVQGIKDISISLSNTGSIIRNLVIVPLTKEPVNIQLLESNLKSPKIF